MRSDYVSQYFIIFLKEREKVLDGTINHASERFPLMSKIREEC